MAGSRRHIVLVGHMGSGKTTLGRLLAERLGRPFCDSDAALLREQGTTARELRRRKGARDLHRAEAGYLLRALAEPEPQVISAAASTIDDDRCFAALSSPDVDVIWLRARPQVLAARHRLGSHRPPPVSDRERLDRERRFDALDAHRLESDRASPEELADAALAALGRRSP